MNDEVHLRGEHPVVRILGRRTIVLLHTIVALWVFAGHRRGFDVLLSEVGDGDESSLS
jgi:hypothetical protein